MDATCSSSSIFSSTCFSTRPRMRPTSSRVSPLALPALSTGAAPSASLPWARPCRKSSRSAVACRTDSEISEASLRPRPSSCASFSPPFRNLSSFGRQRVRPVAARLMSSASAPSPQSLTSSSKACLKTSTIVRCSLSSSTCSRKERCVFSHWRGVSPVRIGGGFSNFGRFATKSMRPRMESSRSFFSCSIRSLRALSSSKAFAAFCFSSATFCMAFSCSSLSLALSPQLLDIICSMSLSCRSNFAFSASRSASERPAAPPPVPAASSFFFSSSTSVLSREICEASSFFVAWTLMALARLA
mmetsp:Transcript_63676/g.205155  ORF Transcript_63676/g.205155 Transcript_63676/m.205155 type:complete len:301 (-) Transcript_63676:294-1196(-)